MAVSLARWAERQNRNHLSICQPEQERNVEKRWTLAVFGWAKCSENAGYKVKEKKVLVEVRSSGCTMGRLHLALLNISGLSF